MYKITMAEIEASREWAAAAKAKAMVEVKASIAAEPGDAVDRVLARAFAPKAKAL